MQSSLYQELTDLELKAVIKNALKTDVISYKQLTGGLFNTTYFVSTAAAGDVVLRVGPVNRHLLMPFEHHLMEAEAHVYALCRQEGIPVSEVMAMDLSKTIIDRDFMIVRYIPSRAMYGVDIPTTEKARICRDIGVATAKMHGIHASKFGRIADVKHGGGFARWSECMMDELNNWQRVAARTTLYSQEDYARLHSVFEMAAPCLDEITTPTLVHTDLWLGNVLITTDDDHPRFAAIIDADRALWGDPEAEFTMIRWMKNEDAFWEGYGKRLEESRTSRIRQGIYNLISHLWNSYVYEMEYNQPDDAVSERENAYIQLAELERIS